jgi:hypothetical protein
LIFAPPGYLQRGAVATLGLAADGRFIIAIKFGVSKKIISMLHRTLSLMADFVAESRRL